jgi:enediyne biosynthesis protein E4
MLTSPRKRRVLLALALWTLILAACAAPAAPPTPSAPPAAVTITTAALAPPAQPCTDAFVAHTLDYTTTAPTKPVILYDSNGSGVAVGDLDGDGDQDIAFANLAGPNAVLWNQGELRFTRQDLPHGLSRAAVIADVDGDTRPDITFTRRNQKPSLLSNTGEPGVERFETTVLPEVNNPFYALTWDDLDRDGDLDLVAGSYDGELAKLDGLIFQQRGGGVGVFVYERRGDTFVQHRLSRQSDALAIALPDLNGDGRRDIWVGNDFDRPDYVWLQGDGLNSWQPIMPSSAISENTMSLDMGDVDNDGDFELFATDMKPLVRDTATMARWLPMMQLMTRPDNSSDPQHPENTLLVQGASGLWYNEAYERSVDASGWSWSGKFGDLDRDGFLDLYVVNGMIAAGLFEHLPGEELIEPNVAWQNDRRGGFNRRPEWQLGSTASGRGMSMADFDGDGDLDIVVNNLDAPAQLFENRLCGGRNVLVDLRWPASGNTAALGATLALHTSAGTFHRDIRAQSGYLSGDPSQAHFGVSQGASIERLVITWPDGAVSEVASLAPGTRVTITR